MSSTITRDTWTNDSGSPAAPNYDGTVLNNAVLQNHIYARVDQMFAGAGSYSTFTFGGLVRAEGFGQHLFSAAGSGDHGLVVRNTQAGTGNSGYVIIQADSSSYLSLQMFSTTRSPYAYVVADSAFIGSLGSTGLQMALLHANASTGAATFGFWAQATRLLHLTYTSALLLFGGVSAPSAYGTGLCVAGNSPMFSFYDADEASNAKFWRLATAGGVLLVQTLPDDFSSATTQLQVTRDGALYVTSHIQCGAFLRIADPTGTSPPTEAGYCAIFVDPADGDLKVKFGDGFEATLRVDA